MFQQQIFQSLFLVCKLSAAQQQRTLPLKLCIVSKMSPVHQKLALKSIVYIQYEYSYKNNVVFYSSIFSKNERATVWKWKTTKNSLGS
jgi:hypothetical protein